MWTFIWFVTIGVSCAEVHVIDNSVRVTRTQNKTDKNGQDDNATTGYRGERNNEITNYLVETEHGPVRGFKDVNGIVRFFDIPYGYFSEESRFEEPAAPKSWTTVHEKTEHTSRCPQINSENNYVGTNECLTLSIFRPENAENVDVLFHIHDSSFNIGSGNPLKYGPKYLVPKGVILVLPNYRIGPLGFLCLHNATAPGNAGMKDLNLALQWTKKNIKAFGGNNSNIVISGSGAAGALVDYLLLSNNSRALISRAITESGFVLSPWALDRYPLETAKDLVKALEKSDKNVETENIFGFFDEINLETLVRAGQGLTFKPCIENSTGFITQSPWYLLNNEKLGISVMAGSANQAAMERALAHTEESVSQINQDFSQLLPDDLKFNNNEEKNSIGRQVRTQYFGENNITMNDIKKLSQCYSDSQYLYPGIRGARLLIKGGAIIYFYEFSYGSRDLVNGSARGDSLNYIFSKDGDTIEDAVQNNLKNIMLNLWVSFIKTGKPSAENIEWDNLKAVKETEEVWLSIGSKVLMQKGFHHDRLKLWDDIYKKHFIEHNLAFKLNSSIYITVLGSIFLITISDHLKY